jgi:hypothetical protein
MLLHSYIECIAGHGNARITGTERASCVGTTLPREEG